MGFATILMVCFILPVFVAQQTPPERHSLYYVYTALSKAVNAPGIFEFTAMGLLDDRKIDYYDSEKKEKIPQQDWMKERLPPDYWEKGTQSRRSKEQWFKVNVNILMERMRQNGSDIHVLMWKHGCEIQEMPDGSFKFARGIDAYSYDGIDFLSFDDTSMQWVAPVSEAVPTKQKWDGVPILNQYTKGYLEKECVDWLEKFRDYGGKELRQQMKASPPEMTLFAKPKAKCVDKLTLTCMATGFYPKDIYMTILKGEHSVLNSDIFQVMPNGDGTHQIKLSMEVKRTELDAYSCEMNHIALTEKIRKSWPKDGSLCETDSSPLIGVAVGVVVGLMLLLVLIGFILVKRGMIEFKNGIKFKGVGKNPGKGSPDSRSTNDTPSGSAEGSQQSVGVEIDAKQPETENLLDNGAVNGKDSDSGKGSTDNSQSSNDTPTGSAKGSQLSLDVRPNLAAKQPETENLLDNGAGTENHIQNPTHN